MLIERFAVCNYITHAIFALHDPNIFLFYFSTPSPGFYNDDDIPDFLVKYAYGPGFPVYYHSEVRMSEPRPKCCNKGDWRHWVNFPPVLQGIHFCDFPFAFLCTSPHLKRGLLENERICLQGERILCFCSRPRLKSGKKKKETKNRKSCCSLSTQASSNEKLKTVHVPGSKTISYQLL